MKAPIIDWPNTTNVMYAEIYVVKPANSADFNTPFSLKYGNKEDNISVTL